MARLANVLDLPEKYVCKKGTTATGIEALMIIRPAEIIPGIIWE